ncbi:hypothetical protein ARMGADRAFT_593188 [Armillaria gallica]|uniref:Uncharacterized protein n=1 Tax=Armillaria gallica TaxID=47427 RepID=A0A2H3CQ41_ARMGA|nr:hypothetical protein ARMGADRAFT_593188 [Armillaria gallica]
MNNRSCDRSFGSPSPSDCEHTPTYKASKWSSPGCVCKQKFFFQTSFDFLVRRFLVFAPPTVAAPQPERHSELVPIVDASICREWPKRSEEPNVPFCRRRERREG